MRTLAAARLDALVWIFLYGGLFVVCIGSALVRAEASYGWIVVVAGLVDALIGGTLVWVRSRLTGPQPHPPHEGTP